MKKQTSSPAPVAVRPINEIAKEIGRIWHNTPSGVYFGARPYLDALQKITNPKENYGQESAESMARYFLSNATTFRGADAKRLKAELKAAFGIK